MFFQQASYLETVNITPDQNTYLLEHRSTLRDLLRLNLKASIWNSWILGIP